MSNVGLVDRFKGWLSVAGAVAVVFYAILRLAYVQFYLPLGLRPEDVGLGKTELLTQALVGPAVFFVLLVLAVIVVLALALVWLVWNMFYVEAIFRLLKPLFAKWPKLTSRWQQRSVKQQLRRASRQMRRFFVPLVVVITLASFGWTAYMLYNNAERAGERVKRGQNVHNVAVRIGPVRIPLLEVRAAPVTVYWKSKEVPTYFDDAPVGCLMYIGESGEKVILFNVLDDSVVRFGAGDAVFSISEHGDLKELCL